MTAAVAQDGSPVALYRRLPAGDDLDVIGPQIPANATVLDLGCGAGRLAHPLTAGGARVTAVDASPEMLAWVSGCETIRAAIEALEIGRQFDVVLLSGNLVNTLDGRQRDAYLATCRRHLAAGGRLLLQRIDPRWATTAQPFSSRRDGITFTFFEVARAGEVLAGAVRYEAEDLDEIHRFRLRVLDDDLLERALAEAGLQLDDWLDERRTWAAAVMRRG